MAARRFWMDSGVRLRPRLGLWASSGFEIAADGPALIAPSGERRLVLIRHGSLTTLLVGHATIVAVICALQQVMEPVLLS